MFGMFVFNVVLWYHGARGRRAGQGQGTAGSGYIHATGKDVSGMAALLPWSGTSFSFDFWTEAEKGTSEPTMIRGAKWARYFALKKIFFQGTSFRWGSLSERESRWKASYGSKPKRTGGNFRTVWQKDSPAYQGLWAFLCIRGRRKKSEKLLTGKMHSRIHWI